MAIYSRRRKARIAHRKVSPRGFSPEEDDVLAHRGVGSRSVATSGGKQQQGREDAAMNRYPDIRENGLIDDLQTAADRGKYKRRKPRFRAPSFASAHLAVSHTDREGDHP